MTETGSQGLKPDLWVALDVRAEARTYLRSKKQQVRSKDNSKKCAKSGGFPMRCYCAEARRVSRRMMRLYEEELRASGLSPAQFELLQHLSRRPGLSQSVLAEAVDLDQTTLSRNLKLMMELGWVRASAGARDKRVSVYALTHAGEAALRVAEPLWERATAKVERALKDVDAVWEVLGELAGVAG